MTNKYIRREDVVDEIHINADDLEQHGGILYAQGARAMAIVVEQMPPADVVPVVRCKDCEYFNIRHWCNLNETDFNPDDYCSYGERREE